MEQRRISRYRVERLLGVGGMGEVYLAEDATLHRKVALKLLPERFTEDPERVRRFQREARAASALNHPNIITIYEVGEDARRHFIATEYIEGQTLRDRISSHQPMTIAEVLDVSIAVAGALAAAHDAGIIHRDIKPENIMVRPDGYVKVLDFGLAKLTDPTKSRDTTTGAVMGTLLYISPEQARGHAPDGRSDIYSLGAVIYEMVTRQPPIMTDSFVELAIAIASKEPAAPSKLAGGLPPEMDRIILKALQKKPDQRYVSAREMLRDLRTLRQELEFENKLSIITGGDPSTAALFLNTTAPLTIPAQSTSSVFARLTERVSSKQLSALVLVLLCATIVAYAVGRNTMIGDRTIDSVAVLPFVNASGDPNSEYLSDGIAESIIDSLSQIPQLQVVARSTVFRYKGKNVDPLAIANELRVRGVVTGQLIQRGDTVIIRASLTDVKRGTQVWGRQYNRNIADVLAVQQEMAEQISGELRTKLSGEEKKVLLSRHAGENSAAYQQYLKGRYYLNKYTEETIRKSVGYFNAAIAEDPEYAAAYAGLADAYYSLSNIYMAPHQAMPRVRDAALRAIQLDDSVAEGHTALALARAWYEWNFPAGEREFRRALDLNPNDAEAHRLYGDFLIATGEMERGIAEKRKAEEIDPLSVLASGDVGRALFYAGRYIEAEAQSQKTLELDDNFANTYALRAQIAAAQNRLPDALALMDKAIAIGGRKPFFVSMLGYLNGVAGNTDKAKEAIAELQASPSYTLPLFLARVNAGLGNKDEALRWLVKLHDERSESIVWLKVDPTLASLHEDPRFVALVKRIGI